VSGVKTGHTCCFASLTIVTQCDKVVICTLSRQTVSFGWFGQMYVAKSISCLYLSRWAGLYWLESCSANLREGLLELGPVTLCKVSMPPLVWNRLCQRLRFS